MPSVRGFGFSDVSCEARDLASRPYDGHANELPASLRQLTYDEYRDIRFRPASAIWSNAPSKFRVQFFHPGFLFKRPVQIALVEDGRSSPVRFSTSWFTYPSSVQPAHLPPDLGFAGFRLHYPLNSAGVYDEVIAFLGASYFRGIGKGQVYGASVRGLAVNIGLPSPEEFPAFRKFWLVRPAPSDNRMLVYALADSVSVAAAYRFEIAPGEDTVVSVESRMFLRRPVEVLGIAPITSMFVFGEERLRQFSDYRPEVHDSDVLLIAAGTGENILRPLRNPTTPRVSRFQIDHLRGFGLLQRDRDFDHYQDLEAVYEKRPSVWVEPEGDWGAGAVGLLELPSGSETDDNVNAYWIPSQPPAVGQAYTLSYRLHFTKFGPREAGGKVAATRIVPGGDRARFLIDFKGGGLASLGPDDPPEAVVTATGGHAGRPVVQRNEHDASWRVFFDVTVAAGATAELRAFLRKGGDVLTETWSYPWQP
jgi:periplasmic glucans biosynthesis protein